jgi:hypothetical protein
MAFRMRFLAALAFDGSPAELLYCMPPIIIDVTTATPTNADRNPMSGLMYLLIRSHCEGSLQLPPLSEAAQSVPAGTVEPFGQVTGGWPANGLSAEGALALGVAAGGVVVAEAANAMGTATSCQSTLVRTRKPKASGNFLSIRLAPCILLHYIVPSRYNQAAQEWFGGYNKSTTPPHTSLCLSFSEISRHSVV